MTTTERLVEYIKSYYNPSNGALTSMWSMGNYDDVFGDGETRGRCWALYKIAKLIGMDVPEPHDPDYS